MEKIGSNSLVNKAYIKSRKNKCEICEKEYHSKKLLRKHFTTVHNQSVNAHICNICTKSYKSQAILTLHMKTIHEKQKQFKCQSCTKSFSQTAHLKHSSN